MEAESSMSPGVKKYVDAAKKATDQRERYIRDVVKKWKFDTIAVHGLYSVEEALEKNQGSVIEPIYMSSSQAWHDSDEMEAALAYLIPGWAYSRIANPSTGYLEQTLALLETYGTDVEATCCATSSGMSAIFSATEPLLALEPQQTGPWNFVSTRQIYGGTHMLFNVRHPHHHLNLVLHLCPLTSAQSPSFQSATAPHNMPLRETPRSPPRKKVLSLEAAASAHPQRAR